MHFGDDNVELLLHRRERDLALMSKGAWKGLGVKPFEDKSTKW